MLLNELKPLNEASYPANIGMMEMFKFYQIATDEQKAMMRDLIAKKLTDDAWKLLSQVTGVNLQKL